MSMDHEQARMLLGARRDGELHDAGALESHLAGCDACRAFDAAIERLSLVASRLPADAPPQRFTPPARRPMRLGAALIAAIVVGLVLIVTGLPVKTFNVTPAAAAAHLVNLRSLDVTRDIEERTADGTVTRVRERVRWQAPAFTRIDRTPDGGVASTIIAGPGVRYERIGTFESLRTGLPPAADLPEPLSPTIALIGRDAGPGPMVAGRPTRRVQIEGPIVTRRALVDAQRAAVLSSTFDVVLQKEGFFRERTVTKRVTSIRYNPSFPPDVFAVPSITPTTGSFRPAAVESLEYAPSALPAGFRVVRAGATIGQEWFLLARGAFLIHVEAGGAAQSFDDQTIESFPAAVGTRVGNVYAGLYSLPSIEFEHRGRLVRISAPMTVKQLSALAAQMYPE